MDNNMWMWMLGTLFPKFVKGKYTLEELRDYFNQRLQREYLDVFIFNEFVSVESIVLKILRENSPFLSIILKCTAGHEESCSTQYSCVVHTYFHRQDDGQQYRGT